MVVGFFDWDLFGYSKRLILSNLLLTNPLMLPKTQNPNITRLQPQIPPKFNRLLLKLFLQPTILFQINLLQKFRHLHLTQNLTQLDQILTRRLRAKVAGSIGAGAAVPVFLLFSGDFVAVAIPFAIAISVTIFLPITVLISGPITFPISVPIRPVFLLTI